MDCRNCGEEQHDEARLCSSCGADLTEEQDRDPDSELIRLYIGEKKADYYTRKWKKGKITWNWAAFLFTFFWLGYRKMYGALIGFLAIITVLQVGLYYLNVGPTASIGTVVAVILGMNGNQLYKEHTQRKVKKMKQMYGEKVERTIEMKGGPNWGGFLLSAAAMILFVVISGAAMPDPALKGSDRTAKDTDEAEETNGEEDTTRNEIDDEYETEDENQDKGLADDQEEPSVEEDMEDEKQTADELFLGATVSAEEMERIYATNCASCHAMDLAGSVGPDLQTIGARYSKKEIADIIENGMDSMPPLDYVDDDEREVLADWLAGLK